MMGLHGIWDTSSGGWCNQIPFYRPSVPTVAVFTFITVKITRNPHETARNRTVRTFVLFSES
jgi:hypothetical protein